MGAATGFVVTFVVLLLGFPREVAPTASLFLVIPGGLMWGLVVMRMALKKKYHDF